MIATGIAWIVLFALMVYAVWAIWPRKPRPYDWERDG